MYRYTAEILIAIAAEKEASDVHLIAGLPPKCRIDGQIRNLTDEPLSYEDCEELGRQLAGEHVRRIDQIGQLDFSATLAGRRIRINLFRQQGALSASLRLLSNTIPKLQELGLPDAVRQFSRWNKGIVLVTGETESPLPWQPFWTRSTRQGPSISLRWRTRSSMCIPRSAPSSTSVRWAWM